MAAPMALVGRRFQYMKIKENSVKFGVPATENEIEVFQHVLFVDPSISRTDHTAKGLQNAKLFHKFLKDHCHCSHYVFQINVMIVLVFFIAWSIPYNTLEKISQNSASFLYHLLHQKNITKRNDRTDQTILCTHTIATSQG